MGVKVEADTSELDARLEGISDALTRDGMRKLARHATSELKRSTGQAFRTASDPAGGKWARRAGNPSWSPLDRTGGLRSALEQSAQLYGNEGQRMLLRATVKDKRSGNRSYHAIAGAQFFGRRDQREYMKGRGQSRGKGGPMPGRRFTGVSTRSRRKLAQRSLEIIRRSS